MPRPTHPKASPAAQEQLKKLCGAGASGSGDAASLGYPASPADEPRRSPLRSRESTQALLGPAWHSPPRVCAADSRVYLCLCSGRAFAWPDDLAGAAPCRHRHDESLSQACLGDLGFLLHSHASRSGRLASLENLDHSGEYAPDLPASLESRSQSH